ncbi:MAG: hypothetical protein ACOY3P_09075 [Planctomycetota bacterium]
MIRQILISSAALAIVLAVFSASDAFGQSPAPSLIQRPSPLQSPWFDLFRRDGGPLPNYYQFVRPRQEIERQFARQQLVNASQQRQIGSLGARLSAEQRGPQLSPTGSAAGFMNYSHFYSGLR